MLKVTQQKLKEVEIKDDLSLELDHGKEEYAHVLLNGSKQ